MKTGASTDSTLVAAAEFLRAPGQMAQLIRDYDWSATSLGPIVSWPQSLRTSVDIVINSPVPMVMLWGSDGIMIYNDAYSIFAGQRHPQLLGSKVLEGWPEVAELNTHVLEVCLAGKTLSYTNQELLLYRNGEAETLWTNLDYSPIKDESGQPMGVMAIVQETTQQILAQRAIRAEQLKMQTLLQKAPAFIAVVSGPEHVYTIANPLYLKIVGNRPIIGKPFREALPELASTGLFDIMDAVYRTGEAYVGNETPIQLDRSGNGALEPGFFNFIYQPIRSDSGQVTDVYIHAVEVTEQVNARQKIESIANINKAITDNATTSLFIMDANFHCIFMNPAAEAMTGYSFRDLVAINKTLHEIIHDKKHDGSHYEGRDCPINQAIVHKKIQAGEEAFVARDGSLYPISFVVSPIISAGKVTGAVMEVRDITAQKQAQADLDRTKQMFDALFDSTVLAIVLANTDGTIVQANKTFLRLFGYTQSDLTRGLSSRQITAPGSRGVTSDIYESIRLTGEAHPVEKRYMRKDGSQFPALVGGVALPQSNNQFMAFILDVTENQDLKDLNKAKDEFIALASHQLRSPASSVKQYLGAIIEEYAGPVSDDQLQFLTIANSANERQLAIINDLLKTAQIDTRGFKLNIQGHDLVSMIKRVIAENEPTADSKNQTISLQCKFESLKVHFDAVELSICITNLIENALKYSPPETTVRVGIKLSKSYVEISIADNGVGIAKSDHDKIFEKFTRVDNSLSDTVSGSGLGLYWVKRIVDIHKGRLKIESEIGVGSTFTIRLPL